MLRLASIASAGSIHLLCGAARVPFTTYIAGTLIGLAPAMFALAGLGALLRQTLLDPSLSNALLAVVAAVLLLAIAALVRTLLADSSLRAIGRQPSRACGVRLVAHGPVHRCGWRPTTCTSASARDGRHDPDRIAKVVIELDADIVALQEFTYPASVALENAQPGRA